LFLAVKAACPIEDFDETGTEKRVFAIKAELKI
jgi:hypothetical protein